MARIAAVDRRAALIQAALRVIARGGVAAATTRAIAAEAGMSLASLHYAFTSRDELIAYVVREQARAAIDTLEPGEELEATIRAALGAYLAVVAADPGRELAMFELSVYALRDPALHGAAREQYEAYRAAATEVIGAVSAHHSVTWRAPHEDLARLIVTLTDGLTLAWLTDRDTAAATRVIGYAASSLAALATEAPLANRPAERPATSAGRPEGVTSAPPIPSIPTDEPNTAPPIPHTPAAELSPIPTTPEPPAASDGTLAVPGSGHPSGSGAGTVAAADVAGFQPGGGQYSGGSGARPAAGIRVADGRAGSAAGVQPRDGHPVPGLNDRWGEL